MIEDLNGAGERPAREEDPGADEADASGDELAHEQIPLEQRVRELEIENTELADRVLRAKAEMVNFRRRTESKRVQQIGRARADVLRDLLPVVDDFERAVAASVDESPEGYREGVEIILRSLLDTLARIGAERIEPEGAPFDPEVCEAVETVATAEVPAGHVAAVYQAGYRFQDLLLRPARVVVASATADEPSEES